MTNDLDSMNSEAIEETSFVNDEYTLWKNTDGTWSIQGINANSGRVFKDSNYVTEGTARRVWANLLIRIEQKNNLRNSKVYRRPKTYRRAA